MKVFLNLKGINNSRFNIKTEYQRDYDLPKAIVGKEAKKSGEETEGSAWKVQRESWGGRC